MSSSCPSLRRLIACARISSASSCGTSPFHSPTSSRTQSSPEATAPSENRTIRSPAESDTVLWERLASVRIPTGRDGMSTVTAFPPLRRTLTAAPAFISSTFPLNRSTAARSSVESDSSPDFARSAELTIFKAQSKPIPALMSVAMMPAAMAPSTAARPPVPIPSLMTAICRPHPSRKNSWLSPQSCPFPNTCWENPL